MKKLLKHMNIIHFIFLILGGLMLLSALPFKTQYNTVSINLEKGKEIAEATAEMTNARGQDQTLLWNFYEGKTFDKEAVYNFQNGINNVNNLILIFGLVMVLGICLLMVLQNHKRKIYYGSNVVGALFINVGIIVFAVIILLQLVNLMGQVGANYELFNNVALLQHPTMRAEVYQNAANISSYYYVNVATILAYIIGFVVCIVYALFVLILSFAKFGRTKERRKELISKAVENND